MQEEEVEGEVQEDLLRCRLLGYPESTFHRSPSFLCVTETESMATVCPSPHSPPLVRGGHLHAFDERLLCQCAQDLQHEKRLVWGALSRGPEASGGRGCGCGWVGRAERRDGSAMQAVRPAGDGPPKAPRQYIERRRVTAVEVHI